MKQEGDDVWLDENDPEWEVLIQEVETVLNDPNTEKFEF